MAEVRDEALLKGRATVIHEAHLNVGDEVMKRRVGVWMWVGWECGWG